MPYEVAPLPFKPPRLNGLSERLLASHFENNYGGAVRRLNAIEADLARLDWITAPTFVINGLKREELVAANSMILHEAYFDGLGGSGDAGGALAAALERDFGSVQRWRQEFTAMGKALGGGSGWVLLTLSERDGRLRNVWAADHTHTLADGRVVLALDMYEHAYHLDFGAKAGAYVDAFMANIAWERVADRHRRAVEGLRPASRSTDAEAPEMSVGEARRTIEGGEILVLDVCWDEDFARCPDMIPTAVHHDARRIGEWADGVPKDCEVLAYCVYGFQVSREAVAELRRRGVSARTLAGGISAWRAMGAPTVPKS
ncbi:Fe-Mn family superoxide dismutase [Azospirillum canadense]|uniref:Fe-Mn family superoxide dismutase n=1 Tax=Azospirillum canadense TaxID=403962 RepID=UPI0022273C2C|nr:Fe-Mn family superoxide dismutase [Azospirillum canadense]MCW2239308.1 Fe-Mn family superoxide dismutase [Azospirillum canadense]